MPNYHFPVLLKEVIYYLKPQPNSNFIDATLGAGGHAEAILTETSPKGRLLGIDQDFELLEIARQNLSKFGERIVLKKGNFRDIKEISLGAGFKQVSGIIFDLGMSSFHLDRSDRGFSFKTSQLLDMRFDPAQGQPAFTLLRKIDLKKLVKILESGGLRRNLWPIAKRIKAKELKTTTQLLEAIGSESGKVRAIIFQAIRIAVNLELENLNEGLPQAVSLLKKGGKIAVISFHSGEDRIVKNFFKQSENLKVINKKPIIPTEEEIRKNPRSSSAKLRVAERV